MTKLTEERLRTLAGMPAKLTEAIGNTKKNPLIVSSLSTFTKAALKDVQYIKYKNERFEYYSGGKSHPSDEDPHIMYLNIDNVNPTNPVDDGPNCVWIDLRNDKPYYIYHSDYNTEEDSVVLDPEVFLAQNKINLKDKNKTIKYLLTRLKDDDENFRTRDMVKSLIKIGVKWPELQALEKSLDSGK